MPFPINWLSRTAGLLILPAAELYLMKSHTKVVVIGHINDVLLYREVSQARRMEAVRELAAEAQELGLY
jgi:hypothetical protein